MRRIMVLCDLLGRHDEVKYRATLEVVLNPTSVDNEIAPIGDTVESFQLAPDQTIPDGDYTRLPFHFDRNEARVHVSGGRMFAGWF
jgi:hypothetical protein